MKRPRQLSAEELFAFSVKKLSGRAASAGELRTSLLARALDPGDVEGVLARLKDYGYLNDARFAESFASARLENEGLGKSRVLRDLRNRRVAPDLAQRTVSSIYADKDEPALIEQYIRRKYRTADRDGLFQSDKELASAYARLMRAGFSSGNSIRVLKRFAANPELLDALEVAPPEFEGPDAE
jgi:regulatory protein